MMPPDPMDWAAFWDEKSARGSDFEATGRGIMDLPAFLYTLREIARALDLRPGDEVLDVGCGTGIIALALSPYVARIEGLDISAAAVARAQSNLSDTDNVRVDVGSITAIDKPDAGFDKVLAYSVLQYLDSKDAAVQALREVARVLRCGGRAMLAANPDCGRRQAFIARMKENTDADARERALSLMEKTLWLTADEAAELARNAGLEPQVTVVHRRLWQHFYMFDLVVTKNG